MSLNRELVVFYITYKLSQRNFPWTTWTELRGGVRTEEGAGLRGGVRTEEGSDTHTNGSVNGDLEAVKEALQDAANEFELRFSRAFSDLHQQLHITPATAYRSFESVMDEVFRDGCVEKEMSPLVARIAEWMTLYLDNHIQDWITAQGGWARFSQIYGQDAAAESRRSQESLKKWLWAGMTLVTGVVVGSLIAQKRL
uniref:BCL2 like 1 n=1 Tax=Neogobius melanostomus TaxID=47308 RepID=A0A8C6SIN0_9GOBI